MKKMMKYTLRAILAIVSMTAFCVLVGEPTEGLSRGGVIMMKAAAIATMFGSFKIYLLTLTERERRELDDEQV